MTLSNLFILKGPQGIERYITRLMCSKTAPLWSVLLEKILNWRDASVLLKQAYLATNLRNIFLTRLNAISQLNLKKRMLHFLSVYSQLSIMKKSKIKQNNHTPYPFLKTKQNKNTRCCMYTTSLEIGKRNSCKIMVSHKNNRVDLIRQIEIRKPNVKKKSL